METTKADVSEEKEGCSVEETTLGVPELKAFAVEVTTAKMVSFGIIATILSGIPYL